MKKKLLLKLRNGIPALFFLFLSRYNFLRDVDGFSPTGTNGEGIAVAIMFSVLAIAVSSIVLFIKHEDKLDFVIPYFVTFFAVWRLVEAIGVLTDCLNSAM